MKVKTDEMLNTFGFFFVEEGRQEQIENSKK